MTFVAGYLGAGKTTLINAVLARAEKPVALLVNDVGSVNIDAKLLKSRSGETIELSDGCVCCSLNEGFGVALDQIRARSEAPEQIIVELSGVAEPDRVLPWAGSAGFMLDGVMTLVDVESYDDLVDHPIIGHPFNAQLQAADMIVLTKADIAVGVDIERVKQSVADRSGGATVVVGQGIDPTAVAGLMQLGGGRPRSIDRLPEPTLFDAHEVSSRLLPKPASRGELEALLASLPSDVVRAKGVTERAGGGSWLIQVVGRRSSIVELPMSETQPATDLVVVRLPGL